MEFITFYNLILCPSHFLGFIRDAGAMGRDVGMINPGFCRGSVPSRLVGVSSSFSLSDIPSTMQAVRLRG